MAPRRKARERKSSGAVELTKSEKSPRKSAKVVKQQQGTPTKPKRKPFLTATSPRKTRGVRRRDEDLECETCGQGEPFQQLFNCPNCICVFHLTCVGLEPETVDYFRTHPAEWRCPRCVPCAACNVYVHDAANVQCRACGRAYHGGCRPKHAPTPVYPYADWCCERCVTLSVGIMSRKASDMTLLPKTEPSDGTPSRKSSPRRKSSPTKTSPAKTKRLSREAKLEVVADDEQPFPKSSNILQMAHNYNNKVEVKSKSVMGRRKPAQKSTTAAETPRRRGWAGRFLAKSDADVKTEAMDEKAGANDVDVLSEKTNYENSDFALAGKMALQKMNVLNQWVYFGQDIRYKPIYESSYPPDIANAPNVYVCDFCFRALADVCQFRNHLTFCRWQHPPGNEIYREGNVSIWEVEGSEEPIYCRNLCLLAKFFLSSKTLYHEVETFTFYVLTEIAEYGCVLAGYFSKEKNPSKNNNLSCLLTLPAHQRKGYGKMLIDLSYQLSKREHKIGSPEHPLSDVGLITYRSYWRSVIVSALRRRRNSHAVSIKDLSIETAVHSADIISTLLALGAVTFRNDGFAIDTNLAFNASLSSFRRRTIDESLLVWEPSFDVVPGNKMNSYAAD